MSIQGTFIPVGKDISYEYDNSVAKFIYSMVDPET